MCFLKRPLNLTKSSLYYWQILRFLCFAHDFWSSVLKSCLFLGKKSFYSYSLYGNVLFFKYFACCSTLFDQNKVTRGFHSTPGLASLCRQRFTTQCVAESIEFREVTFSWNEYVQNTEHKVFVKSKMKISQIKCGQVVFYEL